MSERSRQIAQAITTAPYRELDNIARRLADCLVEEVDAIHADFEISELREAVVHWAENMTPAEELNDE